MKHFNKFLSVFILIIFFSTVYSQKNNDYNASNNFTIKSEKPKFKITFLSEYKLEESKTEKGLKSEFYRAVKGENVFMFKYSEHKNPAVSSDNKIYMNASLESFMNGVGADLIKKYEFKVKKQKGLEAFLKIQDKNLNVFYRVIIVKHVQYQIIVITKTDKKTDEINNFFDSFQI